MQKLISSFIFLFISTIISAQVTSVSYMIDFDYQNGDTLYYDCNLRINSGSATSIQDRIQFNSVFTIITPSEANLEVTESYMPLVFQGTESTEWQISLSIQSPASAPENNLYSILPEIDPSSVYNILNTGDIITLFRVKLIGENLCSYKTRIFDNELDYGIGSEYGGDYSNGFTIGSPEQKYSDNFYSNDYADEIEITLDNATTCVGGFATLSPNLICAPNNLSYSWSNGANTQSITVYNEGSVEYSVTITGPNNYTNILSASVHNVQSILSNSNDNTLCIGEQLDLKLDNGAWTSSDISVMTVDSAGNVTALASGIAVLEYIDIYGCGGEATFTVLETIPVSISGDDEICIGETTTLSSGGEIGTWVSADNSIATITNAGLATGVNAGQVTFVFTSSSTLCQSSPSEPLIVHPSPIINLEETKICPGEVTVSTSNQMSGTWSSNDAGVATIHVTTGLITAIAEGEVTFTFTSSELGCSAESDMLTVSPEIQAIILGSDQICIGGTTQLSPSSGGFWLSVDDGIATVNNSGLVTGIGFGATTFTFQDTINYCADGVTGIVTVGNSQGIANVGTDEICIGTATQLSPNTGGNWISSNTAVAVSNITGEVTGINSGTAQFNFTTDLPECEVIGEDIDILVNELPTIEFTGPSTICAWGWTTISTNGTLHSSGSFSSTFSNQGVITGVIPGITDYWGTNSEGCSSDTIQVTVIGTAEVSNGGPDTLCIGDVTQVLPSVGGTWSSSDNTVATITNNGLVTAVGPGTAILDFTDNMNGCVAGNGLKITVSNVPNVLIQENIICLGSTTQVSPIFGGYWTSSDPTIATIDNNGLITTVSNGIVYFTYISSSTQCPSDQLQLTVLNTPILTADKTEICFSEYIFIELSGTTNFSFDGGPGDVIFILDESVIYFTEPGTYFLYPIDDNSTGCEVSVTQIDVYNNPIIEPASNPTIFVGDTLHIYSPDFIASLYPEDESIVTPITSTSIVGVSAGITQITATSEDGCKSNSIEITVISMDPCQGLDTTDQSYIVGTSYIDYNENGTYDAGDAPLRNVIISTEPGDFSILTDDFGQYILPIAEGSYTLTAKINEGSWIQNLLTIENLQIEDPCNDGFDFGFVPMSTPEESVTLSMANTIARCDFETRFTITVENTGAEPLDGVLAFTYDGETTLFTTDLVDFQVFGNTISAEIGTLSPFEPKTYRVTVKMPSGTSNLPLLAFEAKLYNLSGGLIDEYGYTDQLRCSYDPNDKREYPDRAGEDNLTLMDEDIEYTIRFQNNGNDTAFQVKIVDPLDSNIDPSTIRVINSSHDVETCIEGTDLIFLFEDILLVDSMTNYAGSQGFVTFRCNTKDGRPEMTPVHNQADIIFDTNTAIVTNQTINTLVSELCIDKNTLIEASICDGESYEGYSESGTYTNSFELPFGCDSIVIIDLFVQGVTYAQSTIDICEGESILFNGENYTFSDSVEIVAPLLNDDGCIKSVTTLQVNVTPIVYETIDTTICEGFDYEGLTVAGTYIIDSVDVLTGCSLQYSINLYVLPASDPLCTNSTVELEDDLVNIYPIPASESLFFETDLNWETIQIIDTQGKIINTVSPSDGGKNILDISKYSSGVYMLVFYSKEGNLTKRFVVR
ncbi:MAG: putative repeat protein (TIGR01451 family) [Saprospiraceae bacterium]|jgi:uncharacterized repeat protein (TIGR01451 family)